MPCTCDDQRAQLLDGVVDRVGDRAGDVLGDRRLLRQVAFGDALQLVHQPQNRRLVGVVDALGFLLLAFGLEAPRLRERGALALLRDVQAQEAGAAEDDQERATAAAGRASGR